MKNFVVKAYYNLVHQINHPICIHCGSLFANDSLFCLNCEVRFWTDHMSSGERKVRHSDITVQHLFYWKNDPKMDSRKLVLLLKKYSSRNSWLYYVNKLNESLKFNLNGKAVLVAAPSLRQRPYHTRYLADGLSSLLVIPELRCLRQINPSATAQKDKDLEGRQDIKIEVKPELKTALGGYSTIILVDDVVTSGSTIRSCVSALRSNLAPDVKILPVCLFSREEIH